MAKDLAIVLTDASLESAVTAAYAAQRHRLAFLHISTDDTASAARRSAVQRQLAHFRAEKHATLSLPDLPPSDNPFLSHLAPISLAIQFAAHWSATTIYLPLRTGPNPDPLARATEYIQIWSELTQLPCQQKHIELTAPILELDPWQVIDLAHQLNAPLHLTWTCQTNGPTPCQLCDPCKSRAAAFHRAVKPDPLLCDRR